MAKLEKKAGKGSSDLKQQHLREHKGDFNKDVSLMIAQLIAFKRGVNGRGEPRVGIPPSDIKHPLPDEVGQYLEQMADRFQNVVSDAKTIIDEQEGYSSSRRKSKKELNEEGIEQVATADFDLTKIASWWGSRLWSYMKYSPRLWNEQLKIRMGMLWASTSVSKDLLDLENELLSSDDNAIMKSFHKFSQMDSRVLEDMSEPIYKIIELSKSVMENVDQDAVSVKQDDKKNKAKKDILPDPLSGKLEENPDPETKPEPKEKIEDIKSVIDWKEFDFIKGEFTGANWLIADLAALEYLQESHLFELKSINDEQRTLMTALDYSMRDILSGKSEIEDKDIESFDKFKKLYLSFLKIVSTTLNIVTNKEYKTIDSMKDDIIDLKKQKGLIKSNINNDDIISNRMEKTAHNWLTRVLKKWKLNINPSNTDRVRLKTINDVRVLHEEVGNLQDLLENKKNDVIDVGEKLSSVLFLFSLLADRMIELVDKNNSEFEASTGKTDLKKIKMESRSLMMRIKTKYSNTAEKINNSVESLQGSDG